MKLLMMPLDGSMELFRMATADGDTEQLTSGHEYVSAFDQVDLGPNGPRTTWLRSSPTELGDIWLRDGTGGKSGRAMWLDDVAAPPATGQNGDAIVIVQPLAQPAPRSSPPSGSKPGDAPFTGMSFVPLFENTRVSVLRARMEIDAREGVHTHGSDTIVVHLSGGEIEDTANGKTIVNRWKPGDVEFESRGSSHSARNISHAVDVVLVALKP